MSEIVYNWFSSARLGSARLIWNMEHVLFSFKITVFQQNYAVSHELFQLMLGPFMSDGRVQNHRKIYVQFSK